MQTINQKTKYLKIILTLFVLFAFQSFVFAQDTIPTQIPELEEQVDITATPKYPKPFESVVVTIDAFGIDLNNAIITWTENNKTTLQGKGEKTLRTQTKARGEQLIIKVTIDAPHSKKIERTITLNPQTVDIVWETTTYTPPFYKGKSLYTPESNVKFVAMPSISNTGAPIDPKLINYKWSQDGEVMGTKSGSGKNAFLYNGSILLKPVQILLEATDGNGSVANNSIELAPFNPKIYIYEKNPLYGTLFNKEVSTLFDLGEKQEGTASVFPFFYNIGTRGDKNLEYTWSINSNSIDVPVSQNEMTFRNTENVSGKSIIGVSISDITNFVLDSQKSFLINFKKTSSSFSF